MQVESLISIFSAHFGQIWKISVPIMKRISQIFRNTPYFLSLCHFEGSYSQSKIYFWATSFASWDCMSLYDQILGLEIIRLSRLHSIGTSSEFPLKIKSCSFTIILIWSLMGREATRFYKVYCKLCKLLLFAPMVQMWSI